MKWEAPLTDPGDKSLMKAFQPFFPFFKKVFRNFITSEQVLYIHYLFVTLVCNPFNLQQNPSCWLECQGLLKDNTFFGVFQQFLQETTARIDSTRALFLYRKSWRFASILPLLRDLEAECNGFAEKIQAFSGTVDMLVEVWPNLDGYHQVLVVDVTANSRGCNADWVAEGAVGRCVCWLKGLDLGSLCLYFQIVGSCAVESCVDLKILSLMYIAIYTPWNRGTSPN